MKYYKNPHLRIAYAAHHITTRYALCKRIDYNTNEVLSDEIKRLKLGFKCIYNNNYKCWEAKS